jgi:hypothetical protein
MKRGEYVTFPQNQGGTRRGSFKARNLMEFVNYTSTVQYIRSLGPSFMVGPTGITKKELCRRNGGMRMKSFGTKPSELRI